MSIKSDLDYLEETKGLIKEAIINKGQDIDANTPFRDYVDKIADIQTGPSKPFGVKMYKRFEISANQNDLVNYYLQGAQSGDFTDLNSYQIRLTNINTNLNIPEFHIIQIIDINPALINISTGSYIAGEAQFPNSKLYYFNPSYTQLYIQTANDLDMYEFLVGSFLQQFHMSETALLSLSGWYRDDNSTLVTASVPEYQHVNCHWVIRATVHQYLTSTWGLQNVIDFIDLDETNLNVTLVAEDDTIEQVMNRFRDLNGQFLNTADATSSDILSGKKAFSSNGELTGTMSNNGTLNYTPTTSAQTIPSGYTSGGTIAAVDSSIDSDITAENIKTGVNILGVNGTFTSDANAVALDITENKTAYVNGQKITGSVPQYKSGTTAYGNGSAAVVKSYGVDITGDVSSVILMRPGSYFETAVLNNTLVTALNLTADKIKKDITILGVTGTYAGEGMKQYASVNDMNADINNIANGEVVKVVESGTTTFYLKESEQIEIDGQVSVISEMKKLIKEEDTLSVNEYHEATDLSEDILGNE